MLVANGEMVLMNHDHRLAVVVVARHRTRIVADVLLHDVVASCRQVVVCSAASAPRTPRRKCWSLTVPSGA
jgi:hypothetical protein